VGNRDVAYTGAIAAPVERAQVTMEPQPQGGALQRGSHPQQVAPPVQHPPATPWSGQPGQAPAQPVRAFQPPPTGQAAPEETTSRRGRGGPRAGAGRPPKAVAGPEVQAQPPFPTTSAVSGTVSTDNDPRKIPPFLKHTTTPVASAPNGNFGMQEAAKPTAGVMDAVRTAMGLKT
jgi:hypothetical protein